MAPIVSTPIEGIHATPEVTEITTLVKGKEMTLVPASPSNMFNEENAPLGVGSRAGTHETSSPFCSDNEGEGSEHFIHLSSLPKSLKRTQEAFENMLSSASQGQGVHPKLGQILKWTFDQVEKCLPSTLDARPNPPLNLEQLDPAGSTRPQGLLGLVKEIGLKLTLSEGDPHIQQIVYEAKKEEDPNTTPYFEMATWSNDEKSLQLYQQVKLAVVSDTAGAIVAAVSHSQTYCQAAAAMGSMAIVLPPSSQPPPAALQIVPHPPQPPAGSHQPVPSLPQHPAGQLAPLVPKFPVAPQQSASTAQPSLAEALCHPLAPIPGRPPIQWQQPNLQWGSNDDSDIEQPKRKFNKG
ncbi:hypothetical protein GYMLUDRAFT_239173 [Collybiopsis luxurians FD-317 M1]|nr:hypothetical protein GYMLUDRAFT_239173 [Collybiopsis luxurians FD-317 M1]